MKLWSWFFPPRLELQPGVRQLLEQLLPDLDLDRVEVRAGLPHLLTLIPYDGITLPHCWHPRRLRIYLARHRLGPDGSLADPQGLALLAHEAVHALQAQRSFGGVSVGPWRPFVSLYLACWAGNRFRYLGHPMELEAYYFAGQRGALFDRWCRGPEAKAWLARLLAGEEPLTEAELAELRRACAPLPGAARVAAAGFRLGASLPGARSMVQLFRRSRQAGSHLRLLELPTHLLAFTGLLLWSAAWSGVGAALWLLEAWVEGVGLVLSPFAQLIQGNDRS